MTATETHVLLVNLGTPDRPDELAVREFLEEFLSDPMVIDLPRWLWQPILRKMVLRSRPRRVAELYRSIWYQEACGPVCPADGCSPLTCGTRRMASSLQEALGERAKVDWAFRYGARSIENGLASAREAARVLVVPLFPQRTDSTSGSIIAETERAAEELQMSERVEILSVPADAPGYVAGLADRCRKALGEADGLVEHLLVSYHGIPTRYDRREGGVYVADCEATTRALLEKLGWNPADATVCYQSKFGPEPWLKPATAGLLETLPERGVRSVAVVTPGFLTEGLETLEEIAQQGREDFLEAGGERFVYLPAVEAHPDLIVEIADAVKGRSSTPRAGSRREAS